MRKIGGLIAVVLMALLVIVGCDNSTANNNSSTDKWEDYYQYYLQQIQQQMPDTSWYDKDTAATEYTLNTVQQLQGLFTLVNEGTSDFAGKTINLENREYDLTGIKVPNEGSSFIGSGERDNLSSAKAFAGRFYGNGATIKGVDLSYLVGAGDPVTSGDDEDNTGVGFFGVVKGDASNKAVVKDLVFEGCKLVSTSNTTGIAVGYAENAEISGITVKNCEVIGPQGVGAVVGRLYKGGTISGCTVENTTVKATADGTVDYTDGSGSKSGNYNAGGIVGCVKEGSDANSITVSGNTVDLTSGGAMIYADYFTAGGICGTADTSTFSANTVKVNEVGQISVKDSTGGRAAAIIGNAMTVVYDSDANVNKIEIAGTSYDVENDAADDMSNITQLP